MPALEVISSIASTVMSTVVAVVALIFSYRQNVGWRPVALVTGSNMTGIGGSWHVTLHVTVEFWNRRKYPVVLRHAQAKLTGVEIINVDAKGLDKRDYVRSNCAYKELNAAVDPSKSADVLFEVSFTDQSLDAMKPLFAITIGYFDPYKNRDKTMKLEHRFFYPHMGWKKSDQETAEIVKVFEKLCADDEQRRTAKLEKEELKGAIREALQD